MDVSITNGLEGVRQYFQGLPTATAPSRELGNSSLNNYSTAATSLYTNDYPDTHYLQSSGSLTTKKWLNDSLEESKSNTNVFNVDKSLPTGDESTLPSIQKQGNSMQPPSGYPSHTPSPNVFTNSPDTATVTQMTEKPAVSTSKSDSPQNSTSSVILPTHEMRPHSHEIWKSSYDARPWADVETTKLSQEKPTETIAINNGSNSETIFASQDTTQGNSVSTSSCTTIKACTSFTNSRPNSRDSRLPSQDSKLNDRKDMLQTISLPINETQPVYHEMRPPSHETRLQLSEKKPPSRNSSNDLPFAPQDHTQFIQEVKLPNSDSRFSSNDTTKLITQSNSRPSSRDVRPASVESNRSTSREIRPPSSGTNVPSPYDGRLSEQFRQGVNHESRPASRSASREPQRPSSHESRSQSVEIVQVIPHEAPDLRQSNEEKKLLETQKETWSHRTSHENVNALDSRQMRAPGMDYRQNYNPIRLPSHDIRASFNQVQSNLQDTRPHTNEYLQTEKLDMSRTMAYPETKSQEHIYPTSQNSSVYSNQQSYYNMSQANNRVSVSQYESHLNQHYYPQGGTPRVSENHSYSRSMYPEQHQYDQNRSTSQLSSNTQNRPAYQYPRQIHPDQINDRKLYAHNPHQIELRNNPQLNNSQVQAKPQADPSKPYMYGTNPPHNVVAQSPTTYQSAVPVQQMSHNYKPNLNNTMPTRQYYPGQPHHPSVPQTRLPSHPYSTSHLSTNRAEVPISQPSQYSNYPTANHNHLSSTQYNPPKSSSVHINQNRTSDSYPSSNHLQKNAHNLPPIASLSSVNYHSQKTNREQGLQRLATPRPKQNEHLQNVSVPVLPFSKAPQQQEVRNSTESSRGYKYPPTATQSQQNHSYPYITTVAQNRSFTNTTSSSQMHSQSTSSAQTVLASNSTAYAPAAYHPQAKPALQEAIIKRQQLNQQHVQKVTNQINSTNTFNVRPQLENQSVQNGPLRLDGSNRSTLISSTVKVKRESPLDLSVKTVRTSADSTADDDIHIVEHRTAKNVSGNSRVMPPPIPVPLSYPTTYENYPTNHQRLPINRTSSSGSITSAPKVDFSPNFSASQLAPNSRYPPGATNQRPVTPRIQYGSVPIPSQSQQQKKLPTPTTKAYDNRTAYYQSNTPKYNVPQNAIMPKRPMEELPRVEFPPTNHYSQHIVPQEQKSKEYPRKRLSEPSEPAFPNKVPRVDNWRLSIDQQIEQRFKSYTQSRENQQLTTTVTQSTASMPLVNGHASGKSMYPNKEPIPSSYLSSSQRPSASEHAYNYQAYASQTSTVPNYPLSGQNPESSLAHSRTNSYTKLNQIAANHGPVADKRVLSLLRNSLEIKGAKEAQKRIEQEQFKPVDPHVLYSNRSQFQAVESNIPTQYITPPQSNMVDHSVSSKSYHIPRAVDSVQYDTEFVKENYSDSRNIVPEATGMLPNADLDGLAANLAARIRTKAELKQVDQSQLQFNKSGYSGQSDDLNVVIKTENSDGITGNTPPILTPVPPPRRRLFSKTEEEQVTVTTCSLIAPRDAAIRSSSETSIFDFRDSDSEGEMPVLERQSLDDMRRDRKTVCKGMPDDQNVTIKEEPDDPPDPFFTEACDKFLEQLRVGGTTKKRGRKKKVVIPEETVPKIEVTSYENESFNNVTIKEEIVQNENKESEVITDDVKIIETQTEEPQKIDDDSDSDEPLIKKKISNVRRICESDDDEIIVTKKREKLGAKIKLESTSESSSDSETEVTTNRRRLAETVTNRLRERKKIEPRSSSETSQPKSESPEKKRSKSAIQKKTPFGDGSDFHPGWEEELYRYKQSLRMPVQLINLPKPRLSTSLPDLDPCNSPAASSLPDIDSLNHKKTITSSIPPFKFRKDILDSDIESNSSYSKILDDFEEATSSSFISATSKSAKHPEKENNNSIVDVLASKLGSSTKKKRVKKEIPGPKTIPKAANEYELLPTPSLGIGFSSDSNIKGNKNQKEIESPEKIFASSDAALLGFFRKKTVNNFRDAFRQNLIEPFTPIVYKSRTRKETQVLKQRATIREIFGEDRPASAPPMTNHINLISSTETDKEESAKKKKTLTKIGKSKKENAIPGRAGLRSAIVLRGNRTLLKSKRQLLKTSKKKSHNLLKKIIKKEPKIESDLSSLSDRKDDKTKEPGKEKDKVTDVMSDIIVKQEVKSETPDIEYDEDDVRRVITDIRPPKRKYKLKSMRRKFSSGFDYIRKKKKQVKKEGIERDDKKPKKRIIIQRPNAESVQDIQKEIKGWVLNKGIGETQLHRAARLGYTDVTAYCLESLGSHPSPKDNAGYTPLHEACSRGHLDIAKLLLLYGANVHDSAQGGIRPLHEAAENGYVEIVRLLLSYGADPLLATYSGHTPLSLASEEPTITILQNYLADVQGKDAPNWKFSGPASCFESGEKGYDALDSAPSPDPLTTEEDIQFEYSEMLLPNLYTLREDGPGEYWVLLQDLSALLKVKSKDALLRQLNAPSAASPNSVTAPLQKQIIKEMKMADFLEQGHCCQLLSAGERVNTRGSKIALVKYTDRVKQLLGVKQDYFNRS